ncbi:DUF4892 domain-containing protein [Halopseudomonas aestusnigri]|uniref:DUF4892 domain-containing protein n=1 Tax=Halopseudomonas TaxID=2901189 RepID=UPI0022B6569F|nr:MULTISPECIES: DUF4892 domain-containing protein [Halopseudomonas]BDX20344.1 DUF4892 domain-containing protein [Halopseudomonas aestusnigri]
MALLVRTLPLLVGGFMLAGGSGAQAAQALEQLVVSPFPHSRIVSEGLSAQIDHPVVIGSVRRINNQLRAEREIRVSGELAQLTWEITDGYPPEDAFRHVLGQLVEQPHTLLYACDGRECGSSSLWANQVLHNSQLYGPEDGQRYLALRLDTEPQRFVSLYSITRGNRRSYLNLEQTTPTDAVEQALYPTPSTLLKVLRSEEQLTLPAMAGDAELMASWSRLLVRMMRLDSLLRVQLDGADAPALAETLKAAGVAAQRLTLGSPEPAEGAIIRKVR